MDYCWSDCRCMCSYASNCGQITEQVDCTYVGCAWNDTTKHCSTIGNCVPTQPPNPPDNPSGGSDGGDDYDYDNSSSGDQGSQALGWILAFLICIPLTICAYYRRSKR